MGGAEFQARHLLETMAALDKYDIYYLARHIGVDHEPQNHQLIQIAKPCALGKYGYFLDALQLLRQLETLQPDLIYQRVGCAYTGVAAYYAKRKNCKLVWHVSSTNDVTPAGMRLVDTLLKPHHFIENQMLEYGIRNTNEFIVQTEEQRRLLQKNYHKSATALIRNFIEVPTSGEKRAKPVRVLWIGNLKPLKQPQVFVDLAKELARPGELEFVMVGAPFQKHSMQVDFESKVRAVDGLHYLGKLTQEMVSNELANAHLLVNTSVYEGFSNTFIQAWMHYVPVVSLNVNPDQLLSKNSLGIFSGSIHALKEDIRHLSSHPQMRNAMGQSARQFAVENFSMRNADRLEGYLANLLSPGEQ